MSGKKEAIKEIIKDLHKGLGLEEARARLEKVAGRISSAELAAIEQSLINEGMSPNEIKKLCNVHALLFQESLEQNLVREEPDHPVDLFKRENRELEKITGALRELMAEEVSSGGEEVREKLRDLLARLQEVDLHYTRKEQLLFPYLEKYGFTGPSQVMWGKDNDIRALYKEAAEGLEAAGEALLQEVIGPKLSLLVEEVEGMILKEEQILFPAALEMLTPADWEKIREESGEVGYAFIQEPGEEIPARELPPDIAEEPGDGGRITFPTGSLDRQELEHILNALPVELTFVDAEDTVRYFSDQRERIFVRPKAAIGRKVQNCHPPQSLDLVEKILRSFKAGTRDRAEFWLELKGRLIYITFLAIRDGEGNYLGTLETTQDITDLKTKEGQKRLLDEKE